MELAKTQDQDWSLDSTSVKKPYDETGVELINSLYRTLRNM